LADQGIDFLIVLNFDAHMAGRLAQDFVMDVLVHELACFPCRRGRGFPLRQATRRRRYLLGYMGEMEGFGVTVFGAVAEGGEKISSTKVRAALKAGKPDEAARLLGHWWTVEGHVAHGEKRGRALGFPTANLGLEHVLQPAFGIYAVRARTAASDKVYDGVANFGIRPMFRLPAPLMEVHLFDFAGDLYGQIISVQLIGYLRGELAFADVDALKVQIARDGEEARRILAGVPKEQSP
jgi:riboflavin kinase/FMN adenylyltransferase